jgi:hypothetical protein
MVELVLFACLLKEPTRCETFHLPFEQEMHMVQCMWQSQLQAAQWSGDHPDWTIRKLSCEMPEA